MKKKFAGKPAPQTGKWTRARNVNFVIYVAFSFSAGLAPVFARFTFVVLLLY